MANWTKVVTHPLGFAGYTLSLVFGVLAKYGPSNRWPWLLPIAITLCVLSLMVGLILAFFTETKSKSTVKGSANITKNIVKQTTKGDQSAAINNTGNVNIDYRSDMKK